MKPLHVIKKLKVLSVLFTVVLLGVANTSFATKIYVKNLSDAGPGSLRDVITNSNAGDTIVIDVSGTLNLQSQITISNDLTIIGPGPIHFVIDCSSVGVASSAFHPSNSGLLRIEGIEFTGANGNHAIGSGTGYTGTTEVFGCSFEANNNTALNWDDGNLHVLSCTFKDNSSPNEGGAILFSGVQLKSINCTYYGNLASSQGGAVEVSAGTADFVHNTFYENGSITPIGKALYQSGGTVKLKNNIFFNDSQSDALIEVAAGTMTSQGGNISNDMSTTGLPFGSDNLSLSLNVGINNGSLVKDGWGLTYFPPSAGSDGIDIDQTATNLPVHDQRRVWRIMDSGAGNLYADAGAVEYTPLTITAPGNGGVGNFDYAVNNIYPGLAGKRAFVFEISGSAPHVCQGGWLNINVDSTIINGFSQDSSKVPGPGNTPGLVTPGYTPVVLTDLSSYTAGLRITANDVTVAGLCVVGYNSFSATAIRTLGYNTQISGCHLGVDPTGTNSNPNNVGMLVYNGSAKIGAGRYCGNTHHANRNVISGNTDAQVSLVGMETSLVQSNFIGVASNGVNLPTAAPSTQDTGIVVFNFSTGTGSLIGGEYTWQGNIIADMNFGIWIEAENNKVMNNSIGLDVTGMSDIVGSNDVKGIVVTGSNSFENKIGDVGAGNIISNQNVGIELVNSSNHSIVRGNLIGILRDTTAGGVGNVMDGIYVSTWSSFNMIGGCMPGQGNIIGDNDVGIVFEGGGADNDTVMGNFIGITPQSADIGNSFAGLVFTAAVNNIKVGDVTSGCGNEIAFNGTGIATDGIGNFEIHITGNSFHDNVGIGIDLDDDGENGPGVAVAPFDNDDCQTPALVSAVDCGGTVNLGVQLDVNEDVIIEVFKAADGQEGDSLITQETVSFVSGVTSYIPFGSLPAGTDIVVTATYDGGGGFKNTSEFSSNISITVGTPPAITIVGEDSICDGSSQDFEVASIAGATYNWYLHQDFDPFMIVSATDTSVVTVAMGSPSRATDSLIVVVDEAGCVVRDTMALYYITVPYVDADSVVQIETCGGTGELYFATYDNGATYTMYYNGNQTITATTDNSPNGWFPMTGLPEGTYIIDSIGNGNCYDIVASTYTLSDPLPPTAAAGPDQTICEGSSATLSGSASGGSGTYSYDWDNGAGSTQTVSVSPLGTTQYILTVTDVETICEAEDTVIVTVNALPVVDAGLDADICLDNGLYALSGTPAGGTWSGTGVSGSNFDPLTSLSGTFTLTYTYTDGNGCTDSDDMTMTVSNNPDPGNPLVTGVTCFGGSDGSIMLAPGGSYNYSWTGPSGFTSASQDITGLEAGSYSVVVTDPGSGCTASSGGTVNQPGSLPTLVAAGTNLSCNGDGSGTITITPGAGIAPFQYTIDGGTTYQSGATFSGLFAGAYTVHMVDANGCVSDDTTVTLTEPLAVSVSGSVTSNYNGSEISCNGGSDGELTGVVSGGTTPYTSYDWTLGGSNVGTSLILTGAADGTYTLTVTDNNGCTGSNMVTITEPSAMSISVTTTDPTCFGLADGSLLANVTGGTGTSYTIDWYDDPYITWISSANPASVGDGSYYVEATDVNGCVEQHGPEAITEPANLIVVVSTVDETCSGYADGELDTTSVTGGTTPYSLSWEELPGNTVVGSTAPLGGMTVGDYIGIITDNNGCEARDTVTIGAGETYAPSIWTSFSDSCINTNSYAFADGNAGPPSGVGSESWVFTNGTPGTSTMANPTAVFFNAVGSQEVRYQVVTNAGCVFADTVYVNIYDTATVALVPADVSCFGANDGVVTANATGGSGTYQYSFDGGALSSVNSISGLGAGTYSCYVVDVVSGCQSSTQTIGIAEPTQISFTAAFSDATCGNNTGQIDFQGVTGGVGGYTYSTDGTNYTTVEPITGLGTGTYVPYVQDANGCVQTQNSNVIGNVGTPVPQPTISQTGPVVVCVDNSGSYGYLSVVSNDVSPGTFEWYLAGNVISANDTLFLDDFNTGAHYILVTESNGSCDSPADSVLLDPVVNDAVNNGVIEFCLGDEVVLDVVTSGTITWQDTLGQITDVNSATTTAFPDSYPTVYHYDVIIGGCTFKDSVGLIMDPDCDVITVVNNAFSPNGDGVNDYFTIDANALINNDNTVMILNRWGDVINEYSNYDNLNVAWDGTNTAGEPVPSGTYFYIVEIHDIGFKTTGWIQVVR